MMFLSQNGITSVASDVIVVLLLTLITVATIVGVIVFLCRFANDDGEVRRNRLALLVILGVGFVVRLVFALCIKGYRADYGLFTAMFDSLENVGVGGAYKGNADSVLYPTVYVFYLIFGGLANVVGFSDFALGEQITVKLPLIIADLLSAYAIYKIAGRYINKKTGLTLCAFVCVCPMFFVGSVVWTTPIVFTAMYICFACYFMARKNYACVIAFATAAAFSGKEGIYIFPAVAVFSIYHIVRAAKNIRRDAPKGKAILSSDYNAVITVPCGFVLSFAAAYLIGLFMTASFSFNPFIYIYEFILEPLVDWRYFTYNGLSIYTVFGKNGAAPSARFPAWVFVGIFAAIIFAVTCVVYFTKRNRATMVMLMAYALVTLQIYYPGPTAVGMQSALLIVLAAYALVRDKRLLTVLFAIGLGYTVNSLSVLGSAGYLNNLADYYFDGDGYTGSALMTGAMSAIPIICSVVAALAHLYFTVITVSVGMSGRKKLLGARTGFVASVKEYLIGKQGD